MACQRVMKAVPGSWRKNESCPEGPLRGRGTYFSIIEKDTITMNIMNYRGSHSKKG